MNLETKFTSDKLQNEEEKARMLEKSISRIEQELSVTTDEEKRNELEKALTEVRNK